MNTSKYNEYIQGNIRVLWEHKDGSFILYVPVENKDLKNN